MYVKQGQKRPLDMPKRMIERRGREREKGRRRYREGGREREVKGIYKEIMKGRGIEKESERKKI